MEEFPEAPDSEAPSWLLSDLKYNYECRFPTGRLGFERNKVVLLLQLQTLSLFYFKFSYIAYSFY